MTRDDFIQRLESYLDEYEGTTVLPDDVRDAIRAEVQNTSQIRFRHAPTRYLTMNVMRAAMAAAAAVLVMAVGVFFLAPRVGAPDESGPRPSPSASTSASAAPSATPVAACSTTEVSSAGSGRVDVRWCVARATGETVVVPFSMEAPVDWFEERYGGVQTMWLRPVGGGAIAFVLKDGQTVDEALAEITDREDAVVENQGEFTAGSAPGVVLDVSLAPGVSTGDAEPLIDDPSQPWLLQPDNPARVWIVDRDGQTIMVVTGSALADAVGDALTTVEWGS